MLIDRVRAVKRVYKELDAEIEIFKNKSKISCLKGCSECCLNNAIEATVLEFLPAAYELYRKGGSEQVVDKLALNGEDRRCIFYNPFNEHGGCSMYENLGLICRLFGFSVRADKNGNPQLVSCRIIKHSVNVELLERNLRMSAFTSDSYLKLYGIDPNLAVRHLPINRAIQRAIELVTLHYNFKKPRRA